MSSDSDFDDNNYKKKGKPANDSDDEDNKTKKRPARNHSQKKSFIESDSASDSSNSDDESPAKASSSKKRKATTTKGGKKRARRGSSGSEPEEIKGAEGLELTEEERTKLQMMSEKEREQEIFKRMEELEARKIREQIERRLREKNGEVVEDDDKRKDKSIKMKKKEKRVLSSASEGELSEDDREERRAAVKKVSDWRTGGDSDDDVRINPSEAHRKKKQKSAMEDLMNKRREKEAKKASLAVNDVFGGKDGSESSSSSSSSSRSSSPSSRSSSPVRSRTASPSPQEMANRRTVTCREELLLARLSRFRLAKFVYLPFFSKTVCDCFVRIGVGPQPGRPVASNYRVAQVVEVVETAKVYNVEGQRTNKGLKLRFGKDERVYRLEFVSNTEFSQEEFTEWMNTMKEQNCSLPTMGEVHKKKKDIEAATNHQFTNDEVDQMLAEKRRFKEMPKNFAMSKGHLMQKLAFAKEHGMHDEIRKLQEEIDVIDTRADELDKRRSGDLTGVDWINKKNRNRMKEAFLGSKKADIDMTKEDDPFTRKSGKMKMVSGSAKNLQLLGDPTMGGVGASSSLSSIDIDASETKKVVPSPSISRSTCPPAKKTTDLFSLHAVKIDLDLDLGPSMEEPSTSSRVLPSTATASKGGRPMSLEDYRRRKAEAAAAK